MILGVIMAVEWMTWAMNTDEPCSAGEEVGRDAFLGLGIDVQERGQNAGGAHLRHLPPPPQLAN